MASSIAAASGVARPDRPLRVLSALSFTSQTLLDERRTSEDGEVGVDGSSP